MLRIKTKSGYINVVEIPEHLDKIFDDVDGRVHDYYGGKFIGRLSNLKNEDVEKYVAKKRNNYYKCYLTPIQYRVTKCYTPLESFESMISDAFMGLRGHEYIILEEGL